MKPSLNGWLLRAFFLFMIMIVTADAQSLRFSLHRSTDEPDWATRKSGDFYSTFYFTQQVGFRYTESGGAGTDFLFGNRRGKILEDGEEFPLVSSLRMRNYWIISKSVDLDLSIEGSYYHYPLDTQEDDFVFNLAEEGIFATLSMEIVPSEYVRILIYDNPSLLTEYVDTRGIEDEDGGKRYERVENDFGINVDWLLAKDQNVGFSISRTDTFPLDDEFDSQEGARTSMSLIYEKEFAPYGIAGASATVTGQDFDVVTRSGTQNENYNVFTDLNLTDFTRAYAAAGISVASPDENDFGDEDTSEATGTANIRTDLSKRASHIIAVSRTLQGGFSSANELHDTLSYSLDMVGDYWIWDVFINVSDIDTLSTTVGDFSNQEIGLNARRQLTKFSSLRISASLNERENKDAPPAGESELPPDVLSDYDTQRIDVSILRNIMENLDGQVGVGYVNRDSDNALLDFDRMTYFVNVTYRHQF